jgi:tyrosyl-tRNA synthetase
MSDILAELRWRELLHQYTYIANLQSWLNEKPRTVYAGFDPSSDSMHVGNLVAVMLLRRFQQAGHRPVALVGGATGMIGDPSGKSEERNLLSVEVLRTNVAALEKQLRRFLEFDGGPAAATIANNFDWMGRFGYIEFLREVGKHFPVNVMLAKDSVKARLERTPVRGADISQNSGMSYTEFSYMLLQAFDFVHLFDTCGCELQIGGSDQWGNITAGIDLARRMRGAQLHGITCPLLLKSDGAKMGKSESGALWLSADRTSPYAFYQYWFNTQDADVGKCLRYFSDLTQNEVELLESRHAADPGKRAAQKQLAAELTRLVHGEEALAAALKASEILFGAEIDKASDRLLAEIFSDVPSKEAPRAALESAGIPLVDALCAVGLTKSKSDARRAITDGGAYVNNRRAGSVDARLTTADLAGESIIVLRKGKRNYALLRCVG